MSGRETVLNALRTALGDVPGSESPDDGPVPHGRRADHAGPDVIGLFAERAAEYRATVVRVPMAGAAATVERALARTGARSVVLPPGLPEDLVFQGPWSRLKDVPPLTVNQLDAADAVITTVATAIAVTGTVTLDYGQVFSIARGRYARAFIGVTEGWHVAADEPLATADDVRRHIARIRDQDGYHVPGSLIEEAGLIP